MARKRRFEIRLNGRSAQIAGALFGVAMLAALAIGCVVRNLEPRPEPPPRRFSPTPLERLDRLEGWVPSWTDEPQVVEQATKAGFTDLLFFHGTVDEQGGVKLEDAGNLERGRNLAVLRGARTWLTVTNHGKSLEGALGPGRLKAHADRLTRLLADSRCQHLDLDYESLTTAHANALPELAQLLADRLDAGTRLAFTLQPVDSVLRPQQIDAVTKLLKMPQVYTVRFMMYDYHWSGSLPGALCPIDAYRRLLDHWAPYAHKLTMCLPLYGYDWPEPPDAGVPKAKSVTINDWPKLASQPQFTAAWMKQEAELAVRYKGQWAAVPSFRATTLRVTTALDMGVPAVSYWHLGCGKLAEVANAGNRGADVPEPLAYTELESWDAWLVPFKRRVCKVVTGDGRTLDQYASDYGVSRFNMNRYNEHISGSTLGQEVFIPK
ncbi:MAG: hypothetical protein KF696_11555 [Planctomycetes bacterium]|nr:hypothetical protein [Planctomycetota bacterium]MCW8135229.1 hypothetical protein [Planctomycetota bacterium]